MKIKDHKEMKNGKVTASPVEVITQEDIYIHPKIERRLRGVIDAIVNEKKYGHLRNTGILFTGLPGTGKTLTTQYIVNATNSNLIVGGIANDPNYVKGVYEMARETAKKASKPSIVFWDEVDRFSTRDDVVDPGMRQTLTALLIEMNSLDKNEGVTTIGAANVKKIDIALRRPGRFGKEVEFLPPDFEGRYRILQIHADPEKKKHEFQFDDEDLKKLAQVSYGYTGADLVGLLQEAMENASLDKRKKINYEDFEYALSIQKPSAIRDMPFVEPVFKLDDIGGYDLHKELLYMMFMKSQQGRYLLYGPRGTGKSMMAEALAGELGYNFIVVRGSEPEDKYVGETGKIIDRYLSRAKALAPSILFFDEVDALIERKGTLSHKGSWTGLLQSKLSKDIDGVHIIGALNRIDTIRKTF
ncbi:AAA family ATPase, partial [Candidatus Woesearchaeota archaeon]|nr:AAA family ATPase [Candidatus Woesearchaeota archaeon]